MMLARLVEAQILHGWQILDFEPYGAYRAEDYEPQLRDPCVKYVQWADGTGAWVVLTNTRELLHRDLKLHYAAAR